MMTIAYDEPKDCMFTVSKKFEFLYDYEWMNDPEVQQMILDIDDTKLINPTSAYSPILGSIGVGDLSGGVKGLIMIKHDDERRVYSSCIFGDNCAEWIARLSFQVDFTFYSEHPFYFSNGLPSGVSRPLNAVTVDGLRLTNSHDLFNHTSRYGKW